jgi:signal transduction histidine kinase
MTSLTECLKQVADLYRDKLSAAHINLKIDEEGPLPQLWADGEHLSRAFSNLILNAMEAMPEGGTLSVSARPLEGRVLIEFSDNGKGINEAIRENIFNPFFTTKDTGTGLGLAITHKIIEEHNGSIEVVSTPGAGTTFTLTLPSTQW